MTILRVALSLLVMFVSSTAWLRPCLGADEGEKTFRDSCVNCHNADVIKAKLKGKQPTREEWNEILKKMVGLGAEVPRKKQPALVDYLLQAYGPGAAGEATTSKPEGGSSQGVEPSTPK